MNTTGLVASWVILLLIARGSSDLIQDICIANISPVADDVMQLCRLLETRTNVNGSEVKVMVLA